VVPDKIIASRVVNGMTTLTRPVCPYPELPRYSGVGDTTKASSFVCAADSDQDEPTNAAIAGPQKSAVPAGKRHPDLDFDVRVRGWSQSGGDPAERRQIGEDLTIGCGVGPGREPARLVHVAAAVGVAAIPGSAVTSASRAARSEPVAGPERQHFEWRQLPLQAL